MFPASTKSKVMMTSSRFFSLPGDLISSVVVDWLISDDVMNLDFAVCSKVYRTHWLKNLKNDCIFHYVLLGNSTRSNACTKWYIARHIRTREIVLHDDYLLRNETGIKWWFNTSQLIVNLEFFISDASKVAVLLPACTNLKSLSLQYCSIDEAFWNAVCTHSSLQQLTLAYSQFDSSNSQVAPKVEKLVMKVPWENVGNVEFIMEQFPGLESLTLILLRRLPYNYKLSLNLCPLIVELDLRRVYHYEEDNSGFCNLMRSLKRGLRCLKLPARHRFTAIELQSIVECHSQTLQWLCFTDDAYETAAYSAVDVVDFVNGLPYLHTLHLSITMLHSMQAQKVQITSNRIIHLLVDFDSSIRTNFPCLDGTFPAITKLSLRWASANSIAADIIHFLEHHPLLTIIYIGDEKKRRNLRAMLPHIQVLNYESILNHLK